MPSPQSRPFNGLLKTHGRYRSSLQFLATFSLFVRATDFQAPPALFPVLVQLRQLAASLGDAQSLSGLHLAVARLEGLRGHCVDAHRHLEIARRLAENSGPLALRCSVDLVEASLESFTGNLARSRHLSESCFRLADTEGFVKYKLGSATNLAVVALYGANSRSRRRGPVLRIELRRCLDICQARGPRQPRIA